MHRFLIGLASVAMLSGAASAQTLDKQTSAESSSPESAWTAGFAPGMQKTVTPLSTGQQQGSPPCAPVIASGGRVSSLKAGDSLTAATVLCLTPRTQGNVAGAAVPPPAPTPLTDADKTLKSTAPPNL